MRRIKRNQKKEKGRIYGIIIRVVIPLLLIASVFLYFKLSTKYWNGQDKFAFVFQNQNGDVDITVLDPVLNEESVLIIPGDTEVDVARGYGTLKIKNVWQLGMNEKLKGSLLTQTIMNNFSFPVFLWWDKDNTNIPIGDRIFAFMFMKGIKSIDKTEIDLGKSQFLQKQKLTDGSTGYILNGTISGRLTVYFADNKFGDKNLRFGIVDATGAPGISEQVGQILEVLGGKVVSIDRKSPDNTLDCQVGGKNNDAVGKVATLFSCTKISSSTDLDLEMDIGTKFLLQH